ncbi:MAG: deoxyribodipyrimidine photo-lyase [Actinomycetota bacterium]|nr:deoxyribodipyrimidine photo-lyase [Actinomycetota bacterium]
MTTALFWFRRDLRLADHPALTRAVRDFDRVVPVFILDDALRRGRFASHVRETFMLGCLRALDADLLERGSALVIRAGRPERVLVELAAEVGAAAVLWTSDVSPYARARDRRVTEALCAAGNRVGAAALRPRRGRSTLGADRLARRADRPLCRHARRGRPRTWHERPGGFAPLRRSA